MTTRILNALLGMWLFVTAFMWPHGRRSGTLTIVCAVLTFLLAIASFYTVGGALREPGRRGRAVHRDAGAARR